MPSPHVRRTRHDVGHDMRFSKKAVVVAGGTGGIGNEVARGVVREGGNVLLVARDGARLAERVAELKEIADFANLMGVKTVGLHLGFVPHTNLM